MKESLLIYLRGMLMGICDLIPGISGGTIAFITGIYERLITSVDSVFSHALAKVPLVEKRPHGQIKSSISFLVILLLGIFTSIFLGSHTISYLLENQTIATLAFFSGLILASSKIIFDKIENHTRINILLGTIGLIFGVAISFLSPLSISPSLPYIFIAGFFAISAMFLPGISGAFVLLIMGVYEYMINLIKDVSNNLTEIFVFGFGAFLGAAVISKGIAYLFAKDRCKTLYVLLGLILGALLLPIRRVAGSAEFWTTDLTLYALFFFILGLVTVYLFTKFAPKEN